MAGIGDRKASIGWLIRQAQEMVRGEGLGFEVSEGDL